MIVSNWTKVENTYLQAHDFYGADDLRQSLSLDEFAFSALCKNKIKKNEVFMKKMRKWKALKIET